MGDEARGCPGTAGERCETTTRLGWGTCNRLCFCLEKVPELALCGREAVGGRSHQSPSSSGLGAGPSAPPRRSTSPSPSRATMSRLSKSGLGHPRCCRGRGCQGWALPRHHSHSHLVEELGPGAPEIKGRYW